MSEMLPILFENDDRDMQIAAMQQAKPEVYEREITGTMEGIAVSRGVQYFLFAKE